MLDDDDVELTALTWPAGGLIISILGIVLIVWMVIQVSRNKDECAAKRCEHGTPILANHECLCAEKAR